MLLSNIKMILVIGAFSWCAFFLCFKKSIVPSFSTSQKTCLFNGYCNWIVYLVSCCHDVGGHDDNVDGVCVCVCVCVCFVWIPGDMMVNYLSILHLPLNPIQVYSCYMYVSPSSPSGVSSGVFSAGSYFHCGFSLWDYLRSPGAVNMYYFVCKFYAPFVYLFTYWEGSGPKELLLLVFTSPGCPLVYFTFTRERHEKEKGWLCVKNWLREEEVHEILS